jgi:Fcf1
VTAQLYSLVSITDTLRKDRSDKAASSGHRERHYFVATQDTGLRVRLGRIAGVPIMYLNKVTMVLEAPSEASRRHSKEVTMLMTASMHVSIDACSDSSLGGRGQKFIDGLGNGDCWSSQVSDHTSSKSVEPFNAKTYDIYATD